MEQVIKNLMNLPVGWKRYLTQNGAGEKTYAESVPLSCYKKGGYRMYRTAAGEEWLSKETLYFDGTAPNVLSIATKDLITLPDGKDYHVLDIVPYYDGRGNIDIVEVFV